MLNAAGAKKSTFPGAAGRTGKRPHFLWHLLPYILLLAACYSVFTVAADDPFITYRYAANLLAGHGPVYNIGERVEGFSSPLHLLLCVLLLRIAPTIDILFKAKLLGIAFAALAVYQTQRLGWLARLRPWEILLAQSLVALNINFALAAVNGLETTLYVCVVAATAEAFVRECRGHGRIGSALWLALALATRPETLLLFPALLIVRLLWIRRRQMPLRGVLTWALLFVWIAGLMTLARMAYYGSPLPNTYYAKDVPIARGFYEGYWYLARPLWPTVLDLRVLRDGGAAIGMRMAALGTFVFWGLAIMGCWKRRHTTIGQVCMALIAALALFVLRTGGDWMAGWRYLAAVYPMFAIMQCVGLRKIVGLLPKRVWVAPIPALVALALWGACVWEAPHIPWSAAHFSTNSAELLAASSPLGRKWVATARYIKSRLAPGSTVAYSEMGYAGYINLDKKFIDVRGLTDRDIARLPERYKGAFGVDDETWFMPDDPLHAILQRRKPDTIIAFSHQYTPTMVLGRYYLAAVVSAPQDPTAVITPSLVYVSVGSTR